MANDDDDKKSNLPEGYVIVPNEERDLPPQEKPAFGTYKAAPTKPTKPPAAEPPRGAEPSREEMLEEMGKRTGVYGEREHPAIDLAKQGIEDIRSGEYQEGAHKLFGAVSETLRPLAPLAGTSGAALGALGETIIGGQVGRHAGPAIGLTPELGEDIGSFGVGLATLPRAIARGMRGGSRYAAGRPALTAPGEPAPETLPRTAAEEEPLRELPRPAPRPAPAPTAPPETLAAPSAEGMLDATSRRMFGRPYAMLTHEQQVVVARNAAGGPPGGVERRVTQGEGPLMERRAERMPLPTTARLPLQATTPPEGGEIARPGQPGEEGTLPRTGPPPPPPPTTLGGRAPRTLNEAIDLATGARRGPPGEEAKPPPVDPLKAEFPDPAVRRFARANGPELLRSGADQDTIQAVHDLSNVEVRQAAINSGIDLGTRHVGSRIGLGPEQIGRGDLIDQMIRQGVKPEDIPRLAGKEPVGYTKPMPIPEKNKNTKFGITEPFIHHHELGHAIIGGEHEFDPGPIATQRHPVNKFSGQNISASVLFDFKQFGNKLSQLSTAEGAVRGRKFLEVLAGGMAANEVVDGMRPEVNFSGNGDKRLALRFMDAMGIPPEQRADAWDAAYAAAKGRLTPEVVAIIKDEATRREENLSPIYHYSENRVKYIVDKVKNAREQVKAAAGYTGAVGGEVNPAGQGALPFEESRTPEGPTRPIGAQKLAPWRTPQNLYTFSVEGREGRALQHVQLEAPNRRTAWKKLDQQGGYLRAQMLEEKFPEVGPPLTPVPATARSASAVGLMRRPLDVGEEPTVADVAKALNRDTRSNIGSLALGRAAPEQMVARAREAAIKEALYQLNQANSGKEWYKADIAKQDQILQNELRPELKDPAKLSLFKFAEAIMSVSRDPYMNLKTTFPTWDFYMKNGVFNPVQPITGKSWGPVLKAGYGNAFRYMNNLIDARGEKGAVQWMLADHPTKELRAINYRVPGPADEMQPGAMILGDKRGPFALNLHGVQSAFTADRWVSRTWNRWMGTLEIDNEKGQIASNAPRNPTERSLMKQSFAEAAQLVGLSTSDLQAVLWYFEQSLYRRMGAEAASGNFADAARQIADEAAAKPSASARARLPQRTSSGLSRRR